MDLSSAALVGAAIMADVVSLRRVRGRSARTLAGGRPTRDARLLISSHPLGGSRDCAARAVSVTQHQSNGGN